MVGLISHEHPWTDPDPLVVRTTPYLTFPFSHILLGIALCGALLGIDAIAGQGASMSEGRGWESVATAAGLALAALGLPRAFRGELVVADDGIARRYRSRPWKWAPAGEGQVVMIRGARSWTIFLPSSRGGRGTQWSVLGWRLRQVRAALLAKGYEVGGP